MQCMCVGVYCCVCVCSVCVYCMCVCVFVCTYCLHGYVLAIVCVLCSIETGILCVHVTCALPNEPPVCFGVKGVRGEGKRGSECKSNCKMRPILKIPLQTLC